MRKLLGLVTAGLLVAACGGGDSQSTCEQIGIATCQKACSCLEGPDCAAGPPGGFTLTFDSEADCRGFFVTLACSQGPQAAYNDAAACLPLVQAATCSGTGEDAALSLPTDMACQSPEMD